MIRALSPETNEHIDKDSINVFSKIQEAERWLDLVGRIGWAVVIFGRWMPRYWFTSASQAEWNRFLMHMYHHRHWLRETVAYTLGPRASWMLECPIGTDEWMRF